MPSLKHILDHQKSIFNQQTTFQPFRCFENNDGDTDRTIEITLNFERRRLTFIYQSRKLLTDMFSIILLIEKFSLKCNLRLSVQRTVYLVLLELFSQYFQRINIADKKYPSLTSL